MFMMHVLETLEHHTVLGAGGARRELTRWWWTRRWQSTCSRRLAARCAPLFLIQADNRGGVLRVWQVLGLAVRSRHRRAFWSWVPVILIVNTDDAVNAQVVYVGLFRGRVIG